jgi:anti-sigma regulatory factor (Ser/Thr protein kinase)
LGASPRAAVDARRWVTDLCREIDREELVECAELGVSELVANAILHGKPPVRVRVRGTRNHPRIEVLDGSSQPPLPRADLELEESFLATFGRGLTMVAMSAVAWGAAIESDGKVVWFEPAPEITGEAVEGVIAFIAVEAEPPSREDAVDVELRGLDLGLFTSLEQQYSELRRELRLLSLAHHDAYPLAGDLSATFQAFEREFPTGMSAAALRESAAGGTHLDLTVPMRRDSAPIFTTMLEMFDLADAFCRGERLLSLQRTPAQREFHQWLLGEFVRQLDGELPQPWPGLSRAGVSGQQVS